MRNRMLFVIGALLFVLGQIGVNFLIYKYKNSNVEIPRVQLRDVEENKKDKNKSFAIMLEQDDGSYATTDSNSFNQPGYVFNTEKSGCIDINGNKIENSLSYNESTKSVRVSVSSTAYCYAYFDKKTISTEELITEKGLWSSDLSGDGHRYTGTNPNNYICFGASDKATCTGNTDAYMYRIMGVFESGGTKYMKLIKKEALNSNLVWNSSNSDVDWEGSTLYSAINGSTYLSNTTYMPTGWSDRIKNWTWREVNTLTYESSGTSYYYSSPKSIYQNEILKANNSSVTCANGRDSDGTSARCAVGELKTKVAKIGLMYVSDYALSLGSEALSLTGGTYTNRAKLKTGWMHLSNNDSGAPSAYEWTISRVGLNGSYYGAWGVYSDGQVNNLFVYDTYSVRPVFYLNTEEVIKSGTGSLSDPFLLS